jgi:hypothetical protein
MEVLHPLILQQEIIIYHQQWDSLRPIHLRLQHIQLILPLVHQHIRHKYHNKDNIIQAGLQGLILHNHQQQGLIQHNRILLLALIHNNLVIIILSNLPLVLIL